jgi:hypothetical protein
VLRYATAALSALALLALAGCSVVSDRIYGCTSEQRAFAEAAEAVLLDLQGEGVVGQGEVQSTLGCRDSDDYTTAEVVSRWDDPVAKQARLARAMTARGWNVQSTEMGLCASSQLAGRQAVLSIHTMPEQPNEVFTIVSDGQACAT